MKFCIPLLAFTLLAIFSIAQSVTPTKGTGSKYSISCANLYFEIDTALGARITSFQLDKQELLYNKATDEMRGSTFWPSPQNSTWGWPPIAKLDNKPYNKIVTGNKIKLTSSIDSDWKLRFYKTIYSNTADTSIIIDYTIKNENTVAQKWAPWEVTRVPAKGITVFGKGEGSVTGKMSSFTEEVNGYIWYNQDAHVATSNDFKFICDGKGWLAHINKDGLLFVKKFENIVKSTAAPSEAEIEVYTTTGNTYTELENQGAYVSIASRDSVTWRVRWYARKLPSSVTVSVGSTSLTDYIEALLKREASSNSSKIQSMQSFRVYPNPANDVINIETGQNKNLLVQIYNPKGQMIKGQKLISGNNSVYVGELARGQYLYNIIQNEKSVHTGSVFINR